MNELMIFNNPEFGEIRTVGIDGEPWLVGLDVATALGYQNGSRDINRHVDEEDRKSVSVYDGNQNRSMTIINESGLYSLVLSSKLPGAKKFRRWVTAEVIPSVRRNGGYIHGQEEMSPEELMASALIVAKKTIERQKLRLSALTVENQVMQPKADYFDALVDRNLLTNFRETAKQMNIPPKKFVDFLLEKKFIYRDRKGKLLPYEEKNGGLFEVKECFNDKTQWSGVQTLVTPKGRETFRLLYVE